MDIRTTTFCLVLLSSIGVAAGAEPAYPEVTFQYSPIFDAPCADATKQTINSEAVKELQDRFASFQETWRKDAPQLLGSVPELTNVPFRFREAKAALILCGFPSMANSLMINVSRYLKASAQGPVSPLPVFSNALFYEIIHRYVTDWLDTRGHTTPLLEKYRAESKVVLTHLHLFAIEALVYRKLGREKIWRPGSRVNRQSHPGLSSNARAKSSNCAAASETRSSMAAPRSIEFGAGRAHCEELASIRPCLPGNWLYSPWVRIRAPLLRRHSKAEKRAYGKIKQ